MKDKTINRNPFKIIAFILFLLPLTTYSIKVSADPKLIATIGKVGPFKSIQNLAVDNLGQTYILDKDISKSTIYKLDTQGKPISSFVLDTTTILDLGVDKQNFLYTLETTSKANNVVNTINKWTSLGQSVLKWELPRTDYTEASYTKIAITSDNKLIVSLKDKIKIFNGNGLLLKELKGYLKPNSSNQIIPFSAINRIALNSNNQLLILTKNSELITINLEGKLLKPIVKNINDIGSYGDLAYDTQGFIYDTQFSSQYGISPSLCQCIRQFDPQGKLVKTIGSLGSKKGQFHTPMNFYVDEDHNFYIADTGNNRVQKLKQSGKVIWSTGDQLGELNSANGLVVDSNKNIYVLDAGHYRVQKFSANGSILKAWGSFGLKRGQFSELRNITIDLDDKIYVEDRSYDAVGKFTDRTQVFSSEGNFLSIYQQPWPSFDKSGNVYFIENKIDSTTGEYNYFLNKKDSNGYAQEWPLHYPNSWNNSGLSVLKTYPCIQSLSIDSKQHAYILRCSQSSVFNDPRHPQYSLTVDLQKINTDTGAVVATKQLLSEQNELGVTIPDLDLAIDNRDLIYLQNNLISSDYYTSWNNTLIAGNTSAFDAKLEELGSYKHTASHGSIYSKANHLYILDSAINIYSPISTLKAPLLTEAKILNSLGSVSLSWKDRTSNEAGFKIYRCKEKLSNCIDFRVIKITKANTTSVRLPPPTDFAAGNSYTYRVSALKGQQESLTLQDLELNF